METKTFTTEIAGRHLSVSFSPLAEQATASCMVRYGDTIALITVVVSPHDRPGVNYMPLTVEYEEKYYAAGKIYGSRFVRRETRPTETAVLTGRLVDRSLRPLIAQTIRRDIQVVNTILSLDDKNDPEFTALLGASLCLMRSGLPFTGPTAGVRISQAADGNRIVQPTNEERVGAVADAFFAGTANLITMIEVGAKEAKETDLVAMSETALAEIKKLTAWQTEILSQYPAISTPIQEPAENVELKTMVKEFLNGKIAPAFAQKRTDALQQELVEFITAAGKTELTGAALLIMEQEVDDFVHRYALTEQKRVDGRGFDEVRPLDMQVGILPRTHGSALFMRGQTHALSVVTLGAPGEALMVQGMETNLEKRFIHHYNFPPYATGETGPFRGPGRREIGHGALAEKALTQLIPAQDQFPYTIRVVSEILSSNGSSSMASVCGTSLALMDAGVPMPKHVAGIAMGLLSDASGYRILTDIQGPEDHYGDMDCKVAGTRDGVTAIQMDVKIDGISPKLLAEVLMQAQQARLKILDQMEATIAQPRPELSPFAPRIVILKVPVERIGEVIGGGGKIIQGIIRDTGAAIDISDDGTTYVSGLTPESVQKAVDTIQAILKEYEPGEMVTGTVIKLLDFGAVVEIGPKREGLLHISEMADRHVDAVTDIVSLGQPITARISEILPDGKIRLSLRAPNAGPRESRPGQSSERPRFRQDRGDRFSGNRRP
jgi:polyribonucleotide nucleotidyltransferase